MKKYFIGIILIFIICPAALSKEKSVETIPFIITEYKCVSESVDLVTKNNQCLMVKSEKKEEVTVDQIANFIKKTRKTLCASIDDASFKVWIKLEASGKILGIGTSGESGIEVSFDCKKINRQ